MPRLFVDCDDTLVLWHYTEVKPGIFSIQQDEAGDTYHMNDELISSIPCWLSLHPEYQLVVWSGGGLEYAAGWARKVFGRSGIPYIVLPKNMGTPENHDILIDDMYGELRPRDGRVRVLPPTITRCPVCSDEKEKTPAGRG